ncbi:hypothetical protein [Actinoplanes cyaneus]|nr:hypothetical protein [Actinoplanes cyaneus]MCW2144200.1 hypothetical protein [Actinoplanes cyaneus]
MLTPRWLSRAALFIAFAAAFTGAGAVAPALTSPSHAAVADCDGRPGCD